MLRKPTPGDRQWHAHLRVGLRESQRVSSPCIDLRLQTSTIMRNAFLRPRRTVKRDEQSAKPGLERESSAWDRGRRKGRPRTSPKKPPAAREHGNRFYLRFADVA